jgi:DNA-binding transcriptional ArsR family regulator
MPRTHAPPRFKPATAAPVFAALGDDTRLKLVLRLCSHGPQSITHLSEGADVSRQAITKHLHTLQDVGLVHGKRAGREQIWEIQPKRLSDAQRYLELISNRWDHAIERLRLMVEEAPRSSD